MSSDAGNLVRGLEALNVGPTNVTRAYTLLRWRQDYTNKLVNHKKVMVNCSNCDSLTRDYSTLF